MTRTAKLPVARRCNITPASNGPRVLTMHIGEEQEGYFVNEVKADFGRGFELWKHAGDRAGVVYHVNIDVAHSTCSCADAEYRGHLRPCKHVSALLALSRAGKL